MTNPHPLTEGLISALEHIAGEERPGHHSLCDCPACVANDALSRHADRLSAQPSTEAVKLADEIEAAIERFHDACPQGQGETGDGGEAGRALCQLFYDNSEAIAAALRQSPPLPSDDAISVAALLNWIEDCWPAGSGSDFNQGVVRGFEIIKAQLEAGHIQNHSAALSNVRVDAPKGLDDG